MLNVTSNLETLIRPRLLVTAARHALADYQRAKTLPRLLGLPMGRKLPGPTEALALLMVRERALEQARRHHDASWRASDHVAVMTALLFEAGEISTARLPANIDMPVSVEVRPLPPRRAHARA